MALAILVFSLAFSIVAWVVGQEQPGSPSGNTSFEALRTVPVPEMPALAVALVQATDVAGRDAKIQEVMKSAGVLIFFRVFFDFSRDLKLDRAEPSCSSRTTRSSTG